MTNIILIILSSAVLFAILRWLFIVPKDIERIADALCLIAATQDNHEGSEENDLH